MMTFFSIPMHSRLAQYPQRAMVAVLEANDARVAEPLYTLAETARLLRQRPSTVRDWARGRPNSRPIVTAESDFDAGEPNVPFIGLAEAAIAALFKSVPGVSMQYIRKALDKLQDEIGLAHALASRHLYQHGAQLLFDYVHEDDGTRRLVEVVSQNAVFKDKLKRISYDAEGWVDRLILPSTSRPVLSVDPERASGQPLTVRGGARMVDLLTRFRGGETPSFIARDFGVPVRDVLDIIRAFYCSVEDN